MGCQANVTTPRKARLPPSEACRMTSTPYADLSCRPNFRLLSSVVVCGPTTAAFMSPSALILPARGDINGLAGGLFLRHYERRAGRTPAASRASPPPGSCAIAIARLAVPLSSPPGRSSLPRPVLLPFFSAASAGASPALDPVVAHRCQPSGSGIPRIARAVPFL